jgi:FtsP/CotA-like multicopper oxidase with cupredoxin domain
VAIGLAAAVAWHVLPADSAEPRVQASAPVCAPADDPGAASALNCLTLIAVPDLPAAYGTVQLRPVPGPFGVSTSSFGRPRYRLVATVGGLPDPSSLGPYSVYVAWAYTLALDDEVKLGPVRNGVVDLGEVNYPQFRILVTAEPSAAVTTRGRKLVLRGTSPSARLVAHRDVLQPSAPGALRDAPPTTTADMATMHGSPNATHGSWVMPPMPMGSMVGRGMANMAGLVPQVAPFRPNPGVDPESIPLARASTVMRLSTGDTLRLESGFVRRVIRSKSLVMYGFNGQQPGPMIDVEKGATIVVQFRNGIDQPSAVHWHGVRLDNRYDGAVGVTQEAVAPGAAFTYVVKFPDAGIYWYHPHVREDIQQDLGLYGNMLVRSSQTEPREVNREETLMLDDLVVDDDGLTPHGSEAPTHALMGRFGNVSLINGDPRYELEVRRGEVVRFYLTNASNARMYNLSFLPGARMKVVGSDVGRFEREEWVNSVVIAPAERYIVDVEFDRPGRVALLNRVQALDHMIGTYSPSNDTLGFVAVSNAPATPPLAAEFRQLRRNADVSAEIARYRKLFDAPPAHSLTLTMRTQGLPAAVSNMLIGVNAAVDWNDGMAMMNGLATGKEVQWVLRDSESGKENMEIDWRFRAGDVAKIRVTNDPASPHAMQHPLHLHGQRFLVTSRDGVRMTNLVWKDTAVIPAGETVDLLVDMANPGRWMIHCHVAEHLGAGMMGVFTVEP